MKIETERLIITEFTMDMAEAVHLNSLDEDNRRFVPDEVLRPWRKRQTPWASSWVSTKMATARWCTRYC